VLLLIVLLSALAAAPPATTMTAANAHLSLQATVEPETAAANSELTITFTVTPARGIHIYAPGADYQVVAVKLDAQPGVKVKPTAYPPSEMYHFEPLDEIVPVYMKPFVLKQAVVVGAAAVKGKNAVTLSGTLSYQACDDRVCFRPNAIPFKFELAVKR
jgi:DsbC/DsbD-like thiol-disulfide interchange protein